jgi:hypothetical protein
MSFQVFSDELCSLYCPSVRKMAERGESEGMSPLFHMFPKYHRYKAVRGAREGAAPEESRCVCVARVPQDRGEGDLFTLFEQHAGRSRPERVRLVRDRATGASQSLAFVDFHSRRDASSALERLQSLDSHLGGEQLSVQLAPDDGIDASAPQHAYDWACDDPSCAAINFAKRSECHRCAQRRPFKPQLLEVRCAHAILNHILRSQCGSPEPLWSLPYRMPALSSLISLPAR